ncbi:MAG TPA: hypothetical protein VJ813_21155 [Vicinamibacterales bacterium]|nr:hypothetical protein [Vicinamibacterales bacterium]
MKRLWMSGAAAVMALSIASLGAQTPQTQPPQSQPPQAQQPATPAQNMVTTTLQGCVYKEADIPGRTPNVAEKAGVLEDYILVTSARPSAPAGTSGTTPPSPTAATGMSSTANKAFKLEKIADERLKAVVGKRVEVTGRVDAEHSDTKAAGAPAPDKSPGPDKIELPEFEVTTLREVEGTCPAVPEIRK